MSRPRVYQIFLSSHQKKKKTKSTTLARQKRWLLETNAEFGTMLEGGACVTSNCTRQAEQSNQIWYPFSAPVLQEGGWIVAPQFLTDSVRTATMG